MKNWRMGRKLSWRNASKCVGRIQWNNMVVRDRRHVTDPDEMFRESEEHLQLRQTAVTSRLP
jgi:nitric oxide synthase oxygenase domain/subunit